MMSSAFVITTDYVCNASHDVRSYLYLSGSALRSLLKD